MYVCMYVCMCVCIVLTHGDATASRCDHRGYACMHVCMLSVYFDHVCMHVCIHCFDQWSRNGIV
jgi:hypothetical protein